MQEWVQNMLNIYVMYAVPGFAETHAWYSYLTTAKFNTGPYILQFCSYLGTNCIVSFAEAKKRVGTNLLSYY